MALRLTVIEGPDAGRVFTVPMDEPQLIGRSGEALPISDKTVSRRHAELTPDGGRWFVRDLQSQNHTFVNGVEIAGPVEVSDGDEIRAGSTVLRVGGPPEDESESVELVGDDRLDVDIERRLASNEDSMVLAEPEPGRAAQDHLRVIYQVTKLTTQVLDRELLLEGLLSLIFREFAPQRGVIILVRRDEAAGRSGSGGVPARDWRRDASAPVPLAGSRPAGDDRVLEPGLRLEPAAVKYERQPEDGDAKIQVSTTILRATIREGEGVLSTNAQADPRFASGDSVARYNIRSAICSPIRFGTRTFGAIYIDSSLANYTFTHHQLALLNAIGQHAGLAMANAEKTTRRLQTERMAAIGETVASLSHSIKNILQGLSGGADVVEMGLSKNDPKVARGGWEILRRNLDRIVGLTMNMLTFSRPRQLELSPTNAAAVLEECQELLDDACTAKGVALLIDAEHGVPPVSLDPGLVHQAMMNLMTNAVDAAPKRSGVVTVRVIYHEAGSLNGSGDVGAGLGELALRPVLEIAVVDNGPGIAPDKLGWIFQPFNTTKGLRGTGLGLAVTQRIVGDHGGRLLVESEPGEGATFRVLLPADLGRGIDPSQTTEPGVGFGGGPRGGELDGAG